MSFSKKRKPFREPFRLDKLTTNGFEDAISI